MMYNDEFDRFHNNQYHYGRNSNLPADDYQPSGSSVSPEERPRKKQSFFKSTAAKVIAIVLACAIIGTGCGFGGAALYRNSVKQTVTLQAFVHERLHHLNNFCIIRLCRVHSILFCGY